MFYSIDANRRQRNLFVMGVWSVLDRTYVLDVMHDRSRMTISLLFPTMPARSMPGLYRPGRHCLHKARSAVRCHASRMKVELHLTKNRL